MSLRHLLRTETSDCHAEVDDIFGHFRLDEPESYRAFLSAHARAVPALEEALEAAGIGTLLADWPERRRRDRLLSDIAQLGGKVPVALPVPAFADPAELWGAAYVLEGSKLGGAMLAKAVPADLPNRYLSPFGEKGGMKDFMDRLDAAGISNPADAIVAARAVFALFKRAAELELELAVS